VHPICHTFVYYGEKRQSLEPSVLTNRMSLCISPQHDSLSWRNPQMINEKDDSFFLLCLKIIYSRDSRQNILEALFFYKFLSLYLSVFCLSRDNRLLVTLFIFSFMWQMLPVGYPIVRNWAADGLLIGKWCAFVLWSRQGSGHSCITVTYTALWSS
jgi:hypothetical protein